MEKEEKLMEVLDKKHKEGNGPFDLKGSRIEVKCLNCGCDEFICDDGGMTGISGPIPKVENRNYFNNVCVECGYTFNVRVEIEGYMPDKAYKKTGPTGITG